MISIVESVLILIMSFNVRYANPNDGINIWENRKESVVNLILENAPDLLGMQEVTGGQLRYLSKNLSGYNHFGKPRTKNSDDEHSSIFYNSSKFELLESSTFWLSETPDKPSKGWDAALNRIVTWGKFKHLESGKEFYYFNTHFDHIGEQARLKSTVLLKKKIKEIAQDEDYLVTGDFNYEPSSEFYYALMRTDTTEADLENASSFGENENEKHKKTYTGFSGNENTHTLIDYILVKPSIDVSGYEVIDKMINGKFISDHFPIRAVLKLNSK